MNCLRRSIFTMIAVVAATSSLAQVLETETARLQAKGRLSVSAGYEFQTSSEGTESALPLDFEFGLNDRLELALEPVLYTDISPKPGRGATGAGDTEITLTSLLLDEQPRRPALALAAEIKIPTADDPLIGSGEYDFTGYLILSKRLGNLDTHANIGYQLTGEPPGTQVDNVWIFAVAAQYRVNEKYDVFAEVLGHTAAAPGNDVPEGDSSAGVVSEAGKPDHPPSASALSGIAPSGGESTADQSAELAGSELVGTVGAGCNVTPSVFLSLGLSYDNNHAFLIHPGVTVKW